MLYLVLYYTFQPLPEKCRNVILSSLIISYHFIPHTQGTTQFRVCVLPGTNYLPSYTLSNAMAASRNSLGNPIPAFTEHAISVSLPTWADNVGYEEGEDRVINAMQTGYPRFFIHLNIQKVSNCY